jgi:hypothetical protein
MSERSGRPHPRAASILAARTASEEHVATIEQEYA